MKKITGIFEYKTVEAEELKKHIGQQVRIHGSIYKIRKMSGFAFVLLRTKREVVQCVYSSEVANFSLEELVEESCVIFTANVVAEERSRTGYELQLVETAVLSVPEEASPIVINNKRVDTSIENLLNYRPVTLRNEKERAIFKLQEGITCAMREVFMQEHFTEIHSPKIVYAGAEGGANIFKLDYFGREAYLAQSPQFYKQMMVGVFERVFEIAPVFRAEKHDTSRHLNEYISVDMEMGYISGFEEIMEMETKLLRHVCEYLQENYSRELELLKVRLPEIKEIPAVKFMEAKEMVAREYNREIKDFEDFEPEEEKLLCELIRKKTGSEFVFVTHYPASKRPFYAMDSKAESGGAAEKESGADVPVGEGTGGVVSIGTGEKFVETLSFDLLFRGLEITTGGQRIHSYKEQVAKMEQRGMNVELFESYLMMHKYGMPPHGGLGLGLERFTSKLLEQENVRYSTLFPRDINRLVP